MNIKAAEGVKVESLPTGVFEIPGEPAIVINGVPVAEPPPAAAAAAVSGDSAAPSTTEAGVKPCEDTKPAAIDSLGGVGFGKWLEGREVEKLFAGRYYKGSVTQFDKESGWYRVEYEDGDSEDLDWNELQQVLVPLDISVPLKSLALKFLKKTQKAAPKSVTTSEVR